MPSDTIQQIKDRLDIVEVVGSYIKLQKTGINLRAPCPFHSEKKPSFFVSPTRQMFKCFGCGQGGSVFDFIMKIEGVEFGDALRILARRAGVELKTYHPELQTKRQRLYELCEIACCFFEKQLRESSQGKLAKDYLLQRGLEEETIKKWRLGYSPETWRALSDFLVGKGYKREEIIEAGLAVAKQNISEIRGQISENSRDSYDRFRGRLIFPVFDLNSQVVGFGARVFDKMSNVDNKTEEVAKYINTPNTLLYDKSRVLYGLNFAKMDIRKKDLCILTEGYIDVILSHQAGFENTVATSGTALTPYHLQLLKRYTPNLLTAFDSDLAGDLATKRGIDLALNQDFEVKVICMSQDKDPADVISVDPAAWQDLIGKARGIMDFYFESACSKFNRETAEGKKQISSVLLPKIKQLSNKILQAHFIQKLATLLKINEEVVFEELRALKISEPPFWAGGFSAPPSQMPNISPRTGKLRKDLLEEKILALTLKNPEHLQLLEDDYLQSFSPKAKIILTSLKKAGIKEREKFDRILGKLEKEDDGFKEILDVCSLRNDFEDEDSTEEMQICLAQLKELGVKEKLAVLTEEIKEAETSSDEKKLRELMEQFNQLAKLQ